MWLAEAKPSAAPPSCPTPLRGSASGHQRGGLPRDGLAVFHAQNVVRLREDGGLLTEQLACGGFARRGEGDALL